ncbi:MAG: c-type cytochrome [Melioribacteraceae bacterium]|nr:c-type cytochrome [Melioribacteraceae bacterium]
MKWSASFCIMFLILAANIYAQFSGEKIFQEKCTACHTIGEGKRVGPDLANITQIRDEQWLVKFIKSSQSLINAGDSLAVSVFEENNKVIMPDQPLNETEIKSVIDYISINSPDPANPNLRTPKQIFDAASITDINIRRGKALFEGTTQFAKGGAPCVICHNVQMPDVFSGGMLAKDLSNAFSRLSAAGIDGIIRTPPFPAMANSYAQKPLEDSEVKDIIAFLHQADKTNSGNNAGAAVDISFLAVSLFGLNIAFVLLLFNWRRVKKISVNSFH